jgi:hypothetical protein
MARTSALLIAFVLLGTSAAAQEKPSFAGSWKLAGDPADPFTAPLITVAQDAKTLTVTASTQMGEIKTPYNLDGTETRAPMDFNGTTFDRVTKAAWNGSKLVLTVKSEFNGQSFETKATWSLNTDGTLLVETTRPDFQGGGAPVTSKATYKKG